MKVVDRDEGEAWWVAGSLMQLKATIEVTCGDVTPTVGAGARPRSATT